MYHLHGFPLNRASPDIDFAMAIESWPAFEALRAALLQEPTFRPEAKILHRLRYSSALGDGFPVDLVPFGGVEISPSQVAWPPDMAIVMNVAGYAEALDSAVTVRIADHCEIPVASIPGLVMTKLIAWLDRGQSNPKDAVDFRYLLENYATAGNVDRLYGEELPLLAACDYVFERAGPGLLGMDIASIASAESKEQVVRILADPGLHDRLVMHVLRGESRSDDPVGRLRTDSLNSGSGCSIGPGRDFPTALAGERSYRAGRVCSRCTCQSRSLGVPSMTLSVISIWLLGQSSELHGSGNDLARMTGYAGTKQQRSLRLIRRLPAHLTASPQ